LGGLRNYERLSTSARLELVTALVEAAPDEPAAAAWVSRWLAEKRNCPRPADIRAGFRGVAGVPPGEPKAQYGCSLCGGTGWISKEIGGVWGAKRCACGA